VQEVSTRFVSVPETQFVMVGQTASISCELNRSTERVEWFVNGRPVVESERIQYVHSGCVHHLIINNVQVTDCAEYTAYVNDVHCSVQLIVEGEAKIFVSIYPMHRSGSSCVTAACGRSAGRVRDTRR
jgi:hypothetical protein